MDIDREDDAIAQLYIGRGARTYAAILPQAVVTDFSESLVQTLVLLDDKGFLDPLRRPGASRPAPAPAGEPPLLAEDHERMLEQLPPDMRREVRAMLAPEELDRALQRADVALERLEAQLDDRVVDVVLETRFRAALRAIEHTLPPCADRQESDRALTRWVSISFAAYLGELMAELAKPGKLRERRVFFRAVRVFRAATRRLLPGDRAIFAAYHRDDEGFPVVAALHRITMDEARARFEAFLERLAAGIEEGLREARAPATLAEGQEALAWLAGWVGRRDERALN
jgi:hypothetical protein